MSDKYEQAVETVGRHWLNGDIETGVAYLRETFPEPVNVSDLPKKCMSCTASGLKDGPCCPPLTITP